VTEGRSPSEVVQAYARALRARDVAALEEIVDPDVRGHEQTGEIEGALAFRRNMEGWLSAYPDAAVSTDDLFAHGDRAAWRWTLAGTHAATGRSVTVSGIIIFRVAAGRIAEYWGHYDRAGLAAQLGPGQ
jgi:predicted ester cyclase